MAEYTEEVTVTLYTEAKRPLLADLGPTGFFERQGKMVIAMGLTSSAFEGYDLIANFAEGTHG